LDELYRVGSTENPICIEPHDSPVQPPPRELLAMACASFFQSEDTPLDIFQHSVFWTNVERIYSSNFSARDTAWAVSFCLIILLGLCSQQGENGLSTDFSKPYRSTVIRSLGSTTLFLTPKLINLQTLALLVSSVSKTFKYFNLSQWTRVFQIINLFNLSYGKRFSIKLAILRNKSSRRTCIFPAI